MKNKYAPGREAKITASNLVKFQLKDSSVSAIGL
jgi:hypothetical protein